MIRVPLWVALLTLPTACMVPRHVTDALARAESGVEQANQLYARRCAPEELAAARSSLDFTRIELQQGDIRRAGEHARDSERAAQAAIERARPCAAADRDGDGIPDVVDRCPDEPEDFDGVDDHDGCRDIDPYGDDDGDGIVNIDDLCLDVPEDFDGDQDDDGCPETSEDRDGDGLIDAVDPCPDEAEDLDGFEDEDGCPDPDNDQDGVPDLFDACPLVPEDLDGFEDEDGCPDPDNDTDGVADVDDRCPNQPGPPENDGCPVEDRDNDGVADDVDACPDEPETYNDYLDDDGCPDTPPDATIRVTRTKVEINETIQFETASATLLASSWGVLDQVVKVLGDAPAMRLRIEGHTDSQGSDEANLALSQQRADSVRAYLASRGIAPDRLESIGFGETRPIDTNRTPSGRARNRRVEFHIVRPPEQQP